MSAHTPGPWEAHCRDVSYKGGEWPREMFLQWEVYGPEEPVGRGSFFQADARLIAAAPDLLEALQDTFAMIGESLLRDTFGSDWVHKARAAIAAATQSEGGSDAANEL